MAYNPFLVKKLDWLENNNNHNFKVNIFSDFSKCWSLYLNLGAFGSRFQDFTF